MIDSGQAIRIIKKLDVVLERLERLEARLRLREPNSPGTWICSHGHEHHDQIEAADCGIMFNGKRF
jgi:hypothetical protein